MLKINRSRLTQVVLQQVLCQSEGQIGGSAPPLPQPPQSLLGQPLAPVPEEGAECLKCNTFAELQERLDCIDGSEEVMMLDGWNLVHVVLVIC